MAAAAPGETPSGATEVRGLVSDGYRSTKVCKKMRIFLIINYYVVTDIYNVLLLLRIAV